MRPMPILTLFPSLLAAQTIVTIRPDTVFSVQTILTPQGPVSSATSALPTLPDSLITRTLTLYPLTPGLTVRHVHLPSPATDELQHLLGRTVEVVDTSDHTFRGRLVEITPAALTVLQETGKTTILMRPHIKALQVQSLPQETPRFVYTARSASNRLLLRYEAQGLVCEPEHTVVLDEPQGRLDLAVAFRLENRTRLAWRDATFEYLDAVFAPEPQPMMRRTPAMAAMAAPAETMAQPERVFEYTRYTLPTVQSLPPDSVVRIPSLRLERLAYRKSFYFNASRNDRVWTRIVFSNTSADPLPSGTVLLFQRSGDRLTEFGRLRTERVLPGDPVRLLPGQANDLRVERVERDRRKISDQTWETTVEFKVKNTRPDPATVEIEEPLHGFWEIRSSTIPYRKNRSGSVSFEPTLNPGEETSFSYTVRTRW